MGRHRKDSPGDYAQIEKRDRGRPATIQGGATKAVSDLCTKDYIFIKKNGYTLSEFVREAVSAKVKSLMSPIAQIDQELEEKYKEKERIEAEIESLLERKRKLEENKIREEEERKQEEERKKTIHDEIYKLISNGYESCERFWLTHTIPLATRRLREDFGFKYRDEIQYLILNVASEIGESVESDVREYFKRNP